MQSAFSLVLRNPSAENRMFAHCKYYLVSYRARAAVWNRRRNR